MLTQERLKQLVSYSPETGQMHVLQSTSPQLKNRLPMLVASVDAKGYLKVMLEHRRYQVHRLAFLYMTGTLPKNPTVVDHINRKVADNRWENLRLSTNMENIRNQPATKENTSSGMTGVSVSQRVAGVRYKAHIRVSKHLKHLGTFLTLEEAVSARRAAETLYFTTTHGI